MPPITYAELRPAVEHAAYNQLKDDGGERGFTRDLMRLKGRCSRLVAALEGDDFASDAKAVFAGNGEAAALALEAEIARLRAAITASGVTPSIPPGPGGDTDPEQGA